MENLKAMALLNFRMEIIYKENLIMEDVKEMVDILNQMAVIIKEILKIMLLMDLVNTLIKMVLSMKDYGNIICQMGGDKHIILIKVDTMENFVIIKGMVKAF
jgi:hypothetical protein